MVKKSSVSMMVLLVAAASLIGISSIYQALPTATAQPQQQYTYKITNPLVGTIDNFMFYSSSDGKACMAFAVISEGITKLYHQNYPLGLKPGNDIALLVQDETMCVLLSQANIARTEIQFRVALPPLTTKALPPTIQENFPPNQRLYRIVWVSPSLNIRDLSQ